MALVGKILQAFIQHEREKLSDKFVRNNLPRTLPYEQSVIKIQGTNKIQSGNEEKQSMNK